jgi:hypothetical protein
MVSVTFFGDIATKKFTANANKVFMSKPFCFSPSSPLRLRNEYLGHLVWASIYLYALALRVASGQRQLLFIKRK